jgi:hypothetical protein
MYRPPRSMATAATAPCEGRRGQRVGWRRERWRRERWQRERRRLDGGSGSCGDVRGGGSVGGSCTVGVGGRGTLCVSILTAGSDMEGDHMVTTPLLWPRKTRAFHGLTLRQSQSPRRVCTSATLAPVETSR